MAKEIITQITDDLDGSKDAAELKFAFDGTNYTIDLGKKNRAAFEKALQPYIAAATKVPRRGTSQRKGSVKQRDLTAVRAWASAQGIEVSGRGRIAASVLEQYDAAH